MGCSWRRLDSICYIAQIHDPVKWMMWTYLWQKRKLSPYYACQVSNKVTKQKSINLILYFVSWTYGYPCFLQGLHEIEYFQSNFVLLYCLFFFLFLDASFQQEIVRLCLFKLTPTLHSHQSFGNWTKLEVFFGLFPNKFTKVLEMQSCCSQGWMQRYFKAITSGREW